MLMISIEIMKIVDEKKNNNKKKKRKKQRKAEKSKGEQRL